MRSLIGSQEGESSSFGSKTTSSRLLRRSLTDPLAVFCQRSKRARSSSSITSVCPFHPREVTDD